MAEFSLPDIFEIGGAHNNALDYADHHKIRQ